MEVGRGEGGGGKEGGEGGRGEGKKGGEGGRGVFREWEGKRPARNEAASKRLVFLLFPKHILKNSAIHSFKFCPELTIFTLVRC